MGKRKPVKSGNLNKDVTDMLWELAAYEKNVEKNIFKFHAYRRAAIALANYPKRIKSGEEAMKLPGIGKRIAERIDKFLATGKLPKLEEIKRNKKVNAVKLLTRISGIGPAKARELVNKGVRTLQDLKRMKHNLTHHQQIGLKYFHDFELNIPRSEVAQIERILKKKIAYFDNNYVVTICGSYRRGKSSSGDIDCLITHPIYSSDEQKAVKSQYQNSLKSIVHALEGDGFIIDRIALGNTKFMGVCQLNKKPARRLDIRLTLYDHYYCSLLYFTGSDLFNRRMRAHALQNGFKLNEYSLRPIGETGRLGDPVPLRSERDIFKYINYPYRRPEDRDS